MTSDTQTLTEQRELLVSFVAYEHSKKHSPIQTNMNHPSMIVKVPDIPYGTLPRNVLDVYYHKKHTTKSPVIICIHGGMWCYSDKEVAAEMSINLAMRGYVVITPSYTLSSIRTIVPHLWGTMAGFSCVTSFFFSVTMHVAYLIILILSWICVLVCDLSTRQQASMLHPCHSNDIMSVWAWTQTNVSQYHGNPKSCYLLGHSAGAHLAALVGNMVGVDRCPGVISISGVYSDRMLRQLWLGGMILGNVFGDDYDKTNAFPIYNVTRGSPPHLLMNAEYDFSLKRHTYVYGLLLKVNQVAMKQISYPSTNHFSIRKYWDRENKHILDDICRFIVSCESGYTN